MENIIKLSKTQAKTATRVTAICKRAKVMPTPEVIKQAVRETSVNGERMLPGLRKCNLIFGASLVLETQLEKRCSYNRLVIELAREVAFIGGVVRPHQSFAAAANALNGICGDDAVRRGVTFGRCEAAYITTSTRFETNCSVRPPPNAQLPARSVPLFQY